jgi:hypothetical protein
MGTFLNKLAAHPPGGIAFIFARTETKIFQEAANKATCLFFPQGRYIFCTGDGVPASGNAGAPSVFLCYGPEAVSRIKEYNKTRSGLLYFNS